MLAECLVSLLIEIFLSVYSQIIVDKGYLFNILHVVFDNLRVIGNNRAVVVVISQSLVHIVGKTWVENSVTAVVDKPLNMAVHKLCRETYRI